MKITPLDIQQQQFKTKFRGFDVREVDRFLEQMADAFEAMLRENEGFSQKIQRVKAENVGYKKREEAFKRAMLNSQKVLEQMKNNARKSAELVVAEAEVQAEKILNKAHNRLAQLHEDITELKRQRIQIEVQIGAVLDAHTKLLEIGKEGMETLDEDESKLKFIKKS
ncbi:MAG: DivIVA domain-containing protein [Deltaproteobacteria bacterium]|nr:DivIVA domain-containing protein [Deltaproteobacteria bacterium]